MSAATVVKVIFVLAVLVLASIAGLWLSGFVFFGLAKVNPMGQTDLGTWWTYWSAYKDDPVVSKRLITAALIGFGIVYGAIVAAVIGAMRDRRLLHGAARFANPSEIARANLFGTDGIIIGKWRNKFLIFGGMQFVLLAAPTRSGKGVGIVIPNLLAWNGSVVVLDVKQENFMITSGYRAKCGHECYLFNPFAADGKTHRYNPLGYVSDDPRLRVTEILAIGTALYPGQGKDSFFDEAARNLFLGLGLMVFETEGLPRTIGEMLRQSSGKGRPVKEYLQGIIDRRNFREHSDIELSDIGDDEEGVIEILCDQLGLERIDVELLLQDGAPVTVAKAVKADQAREVGTALEAAGASVGLQAQLVPVLDWDGEGEPPLSPQCVDALSRFLNTSDNTLSSILASFNVPLTLWASPIFDAATSTNDFDLRDVRRRRMSIYLGIPANKLAEAELILNLFFTQLINLNTDEVFGSTPDLKFQCLLLMDEFAAPGRIAIIDKANAYIAGYGLRLLTIIQSPGQLEAEPRKGYGRESARTLITNHACQILYTPREQQDANAYSEMLGTFTFKAIGRSRQLVGKSSRSESESDQKRALMLPQELKEMPQSEQIINLENTKPIRCTKIAYYQDAVFMDRLKTVSSSLAKLKGMPSRSQLETAWGSGELAAAVPVLDFDLHQALTENRLREAVVADVAAGIDLRRIALDTASIAAVADGADISADKVESVVNEFFDSLYASAGIKPSQADDDTGDEELVDEDEDGSSPPMSAAELAALEAEFGDDQADASDAVDQDDASDAPANTISAAELDADERTQIDLAALYDELVDDSGADDVPDFIPDFIDEPLDVIDEDDIDPDQSPDGSGMPGMLDLSILDKPIRSPGH